MALPTGQHYLWSGRLWSDLCPAKLDSGHFPWFNYCSIDLMSKQLTFSTSLNNFVTDLEQENIYIFCDFINLEQI